MLFKCIFQRWLCLEQSKSEWKGKQRQVFTLDGCHLKSHICSKRLICGEKLLKSRNLVLTVGHWGGWIYLCQNSHNFWGKQNMPPFSEGDKTLNGFILSFWDKGFWILCRGSEIGISVACDIIKSQLPCQLMLGHLKILLLFPRWC